MIRLLAAGALATVLMVTPALADPPSPSPLVLPTVPPVGAGYQAPAVSTPSGDMVGVTQRPFVGISLDDVVGLALSRNTNLQISQANRRIARYEIVAAKGAYDLRFQVAPAYQFGVEPPLNPLQATATGGSVSQSSTGVAAGISGQTRGGQSFSLSASGQGINNNSPYNSFNPYYATAITLAFTQPLGRGAGMNDARRQLELSSINDAAVTDQALIDASNTLAAALDSYWDLVSAWRQVAIQEEGLTTAKAQAESNQRLVARGQMAEVDVAEANAQVSIFQDNVFSAIQNVAVLQNQLKTNLLSDPSDPIWQANLVPTAALIALPPEPTLADVVSRALTSRPEMAQLGEQRHSADIGLAYAKNQAKPQVDLQLGYSLNGLAGKVQPLAGNPVFSVLGSEVATTNELIGLANKNLPAGQPALTPLPAFTFSTPSYLNGGLGKSFNNMFAARFPTYQASLVFSLPLRNRTAKAQVAIADQQRKQVDIHAEALAQRIVAESRNAVQAYETARYRLVSASDARAAAERVQVGEQRKFAHGQSTTYLVLQRQLQVASDQGRELQAQTDLNKAVVELQRVTADILSDNHVDVKTIGSGPQPVALPTLAP